MRRVASRHPRALPERAHPAVSVPVPEHRLQDAAFRVPAADVAGRDRCAGEGGRHGRDQLPSQHGDHPALPPHDGAWERAEQDGGDVHRAEDPERRGGTAVHLRHRGEVLRRGNGAGRDGHRARGAAVGAAAETHHPVLPAAVG